MELDREDRPGPAAEEEGDGGARRGRGEWFQGFGEGYHGRINMVLRTFMLALISKEVLSQGDTDRHAEENGGRRRQSGRRSEGTCGCGDSP